MSGGACGFSAFFFYSEYCKFVKTYGVCFCFSLQGNVFRCKIFLIVILWRKAMSSVSLGCRVDKTEENLNGWCEVERIPPGEVCVVCLGGDGTQDTRAANGNVKGIQEEINKVLGRGIPVYGIAYSFAKRGQNKARKMEYARRGMINSQGQCEKIAAMDNGQEPDLAYIEEIYKRVIEPRITKNRGTERIDVEEAAANLRKITFMAHCHGAFVALKLEDVMAQKMSALGYAAKEQAFIQKQMLVVAQAPACPLGVSKSTVVGFLSANDCEMPHPLNYLSVYIDKRMREDWAYTYAVMGNDTLGKATTTPFELRPCFLSGGMGNCFLIKQKYAYDKEEGPCLINEKEHGFVGFHDEELTPDGKILQKFAFNTMINGIKNSKQQSKKLVPLPEIETLVCQDEKERNVFNLMCQNGEKLGRDAYNYGRALVAAQRQKQK